MIRISRCCADLFLNDLDLALDLLPDDAGVCDPVADLLDLSFKFAQPPAALFILLSGPVMAFPSVLKISPDRLLVFFYRFKFREVLLVL